jgi:GMP synthase-like glutamine amidotransferase
MNQKILILKNTPRENPGIIESVLLENDLLYQIIDFDQTTVIQSVKKYGALIVLGGPESANDPSPKILRELDLISQAIKSDIPYLGICLGLQTLVKALGGEVIKCETKEIGFRDRNDQFFTIRLTNEGKSDNLFNNLPEIFTVFQLHGETVKIIPQMTLLATGDNCRNQIVKFGHRAYGIQSHFELTKDLLESWIIEDSDLQKLNAVQLISDFESIVTDYQKTGRQLFRNFLILSGLIK